ncbi:MAG: CBS domain-containing protein [Candidatus Caldarchaeum sp.]|nr:CBS domain-containing protein [Candidatus Caldarchaeum sp.]
MPVFKRSVRFSPLKASDLMSSPPVVVGEDATIDDVSRVMWDSGVGSVLIVDRENKLVGIITERDILYAASHLMFGKDVKAKSLMSKNLVTANAEDIVVSVVEKMKDFNIRHIPVVDSEGRPLGVISSRDVLDFGVRLLSLFMSSA